MKEARFIKLRKKSWDNLETSFVNGDKKSPDELADLYVELSDDLSYSRTFYPRSKTTSYLNQVALQIHRKIYRNKKEERGRFAAFWLEEIPGLMYSARKAMLSSLILFLLAAAIGALSMKFNPEFARLIMGDSYVDMTLANIDKDDPMGVYGDMRQDDMFMMITVNNIMVSFVVFVLGIFGPLFPAAMLIRNGIMLGCFQYFFYQQGVLQSSLQAIWVHGTIEITSIVIAGGAGMHLGSGWLFPGTYTRMESFVQKARESVKIIVGLVPFFILAGFLEAFVTRFYKVTWLSVPVITISIGLVFWYFLYLPIMQHRHERNK